MPTPDQIRARYIDELLGATSVLAEVESAAVGEAWASGAVAEWLALDGQPGQLASKVAATAPLAAQLIGWIDGADAPGPSEEVGWLADVGQHELTKAVQLNQADADDAGVILEYTAPSGDRHDLSVSIEGGAIVGIAVGPEGLAIAAVNADRDDVRVQNLDARRALEIVRDALAQPLGDLSPAAEATLPLVVRRVGFSASELAEFASASTDRTIPPRDAEDDTYSAELLASALRTPLAEPQPAAVDLALQQFAERLNSADPDALTVFDIADLDPAEPTTLDRFIALIASYLAPKSLEPHTDPQFAALVELEPADWIGVIVGMTRAAPGTDIDGEVLVRFINKAPEITTTIPKADAPRLAWAFEQMLYSWEVTGVLDGDGKVGEAARWLLPRAAIAAWTT